MSSNDKKPVIFLAFANETESQNTGDVPRYLASLQEEKRKIQDILLEAQKDGNCELKLEAFTRVDDIFEVFQSPEYRDRIAIFHFGGHAGSNELLFEKAGGGNLEANAEGLAKFFGHQKGLELVFLNGCSTREQVEGLFKADIPAVIATETEIDDLLATQFAVFFYGGLANGLAIQKAFDQAKAQIETVRGKKAPDSGSKGGLGKRNRNHSSQLPWRLHIKPGAESITNWSLTKAANNYLFGLPKLQKQGLFPENPYQKPHGFKKEDAEYFFGRDQEIRELYDLVTDPDSAPLILFYGQAWVGKSSLLEAGLIPRLEDTHKILNCHLDEQKNLSEVFKVAFKTKDTTPFLEAWQATESECGKPVTVIIDQFEEVFNRRSKANKDDPEKFEQEIEKFKGEIENFLKDLLPVFKDITSRPQGKLVLSIRKEHEADLRQNLKEHGLGGMYSEFFLMRLQVHGVIEAIRGLEKTDYLKNHYELEIEESLPQLIAGDLLEDPESTVALTLQILLTEMWRQAKATQKKEANKYPVFDEHSYLKLKRGCLHLEDFLNEKLKDLEDWNGEFVTTGLVHDLLFEHVSKLNTAVSLSEYQLKEIYSDRVKDIQELVQVCKNSGLLVDLSRDENEDSMASRLTHDALAPVVRARFEESDRPGQRARKILENRRDEWENGRIGTTLDTVDLRMVETGKVGMRCQTSDEVRLIEASHKEQSRKKIITNGLYVVAAVALLSASVYFVKARNAGIRASEEKARVHAARVVSLAESQEDPLLASLLLLSLKGQPEPAHGVRVALETVQKHIPRDIMRDHTDSVTGVQCNQNRGQAITASNDGTAKVWSLEGRHKTISLDGRDGGLYGAVFNQFGDRFVTWTAGTVHIWESSKTPSKTLVGCHADEIYSVAFRPDGQHLLTATANGKIRVWDVHNQGELDHTRINDCNNDNVTGGYYGKLIEALDIPEAEGFQDSVVMTASYSPDGRYVVSALEDGRIIIWSVDGNKYLKPYTSTDHKDAAVLFAVFSHENEDPADKSVYLATVDDSNDKVAFLWKLEISEETGEVIGLFESGTLEGHSKSITGVRFSPDNNQILTMSEDKTAMLWRLDMKEDADNPFAPVKLIGHREGVGSGEFSPDGKHIVTGSGDDTLRVWNLGRIEGSELKDPLEFTGHTDDVTDVVFCPDSDSVVSASYDNQVRLWDVSGSSEPLLLIKEQSAALDAQFSPDGTYIAAAFKDSAARVWGNSTQNQKLTFKRKLGAKPVKSIDFSPKYNEESDETPLTILTVRDGDDANAGSTPVQEWWLTDSPAKTLFSIQGKFSKALYHPNKEQYIVTTPGTGSGQASIWDGKGGETPLYSHKLENEKTRHAEISRDGAKVVTAIGPNALISSLMDQKCIDVDDKCSKSNEMCEGTGDERCETASEACDEAVKDCVVEYKGQGLWLEMAAFSHDGQEIATASADGRVRVFSVDYQKEYPPFLKAVKSIEFGPQDQRLLAASDSGEARIWNKDGSGEPILFKVDNSAMNSARFDPLAERVITTSADGSVRIWRYQWDHLLDYLDSSTSVCLTVEQRMRFLTEGYKTACNEYQECVNPDNKDQNDDEDCVSEL